MNSTAISRQVPRRVLLAIIVLTGVLAVVAAAYLTTRGWNTSAQEIAHALGHLPKPLQTLIGGSQMAHLLNSVSQ